MAKSGPRLQSESGPLPDVSTLTSEQRTLAERITKATHPDTGLEVYFMPGELLPEWAEPNQSPSLGFG